MPGDEFAIVWAEAVAMARSGDHRSASHIEDLLRSKGYSHVVNSWRDRWEHDRLNQLCREADGDNSDAYRT